jgi:hypothetical protein
MLIFKVAIAAALVFASSAAFAGEHRVQKVNVHIRDYCDPVTFNAVLGAGACVRMTDTGAITFTGFLAELTADKSVGAWRFVPEHIAAEHDATTKIKAMNLGGEAHTFTRVKNFGGGFVTVLNGPAGVPKLAPECARVVNGNVVPAPGVIVIPPGGTFNATVGDDDNAKFQCCIHPWMRTQVVHEDHDHD